MIETVETEHGSKEHIIVEDSIKNEWAEVVVACGHDHFMLENGAHVYESVEDIPDEKLCDNCKEQWRIVYSNVN